MSDAEKKKPLVLIIDDEIHVRRMLQICLERSGYDVSLAASGDDGINLAIDRKPDAILLDLGLPDMDGMLVLKQLREWTQTPIIVVSVRAREDEKISALDKGANDYITKPFGTGELLARLRVVRRTSQTQPITHIFKAGHLEVDLANKMVKVKSRPIKLRRTEYAVLAVFVQHAGKPLTQSYLLHEVWGSSDPARTPELRVYIRFLREKIEIDPANPELLITESGVGYRLVAPD